jgi:hypothetical protein
MRHQVLSDNLLKPWWGLATENAIGNVLWGPDSDDTTSSRIDLEIRFRQRLDALNNHVFNVRGDLNTRLAGKLL